MRDEKGRFSRPGQLAPPPESTPAQAQAPGSAPQDAISAPQALKPSARELWGKLGPEFRPLQEEWARRERETADVFRRHGESQKAITAYDSAMRPYEATIRASGMEPVKYVENLLQTAHQLTYASPAQKADLLANIIVQYGSDLLGNDSQDPNMPSNPLDRALTSQLSGQGAPGPSAAQSQYRDPRVDELFSYLQQNAAKQSETKASEASRTIEKFEASGHEFLGDVAQDITRMLDIYSDQTIHTSN